MKRSEKPSGKTQRRPRQPQIGIWWDDGQTCVVLAHPITENVEGGEWLDSGWTHVREWPSVASRFGKAPGDEYFSVPRGRVVIHRATGEAILYHGNATPDKRLKLIAARFHLGVWRACQDDHYAMGETADELFDEGDE